MKLLIGFGYCLMFFSLFMIAASIWGISKSRDRAECYRHAKQVSDCEQPGAFERFVRWTIEP